MNLAGEMFAAKLLEAIAHGINSPKGRKRHEALRVVLGSYFRGIEKDFPLADTLRIAKRHEEPREAESDLQGELQLLYREWVDGHADELEAVLADSVGESVNDGFTGTLSEWVARYKLPQPKSFDALVPKEILDWTREYCAKLVGGMNEESVRTLAGITAQGMEEQVGIPGISRLIRDEFEDMSKYRADMIARTETARAFAEGNLKAADAVGCTEKEWIGFDACDVCTGNIAQGRVSFDTDWSSGDDCPPAHPHCACDVAYYGATRESVEGTIGEEISVQDIPGICADEPEFIAEAEGEKCEARQRRALESYKPMTKEKEAIATHSEDWIAKLLNGEKQPDNTPFDVLVGKNAIEIKTIIAGKNPKITMHPESLARKILFARQNGVSAHTLAITGEFDLRILKGKQQVLASNMRIFYKEGIGSFRLNSMEEITVERLLQLLGRI